MLKLLNPWVLLAFILALGGATAYGIKLGKGMEQAKRAEEMSLEQRIQQTLAHEASKIKVINRTVQNKVETITREVPIYRDCRHDPATVGLLNDLLTGKARAEPSGGGIVPASDTPR